MPENENNQSPKKKGFLWVVIIVLIILLAAIAGGYAYCQYYGTPSWMSYGSTGGIEDTIEPGATESLETPEPSTTPAVTAEPTATPEPVESEEPEIAEEPEAVEETENTVEATIAEAPVVVLTSSPYIGADAAAEAALTHSKVTEKDADFSAVVLEEQNGIMMYQVLFNANDVDYEYLIDSLTGRVESWRKTTNNNEAAVAAMASTDVEEPEESPEPAAEVEESGTILISESEAKELAMAHANIKESDLSSVSCKLKLDGLSLVYDVEMKTKLMEYDYNVDAITGEITSFEVEVIKK